jgi:hypothetical protein
MWQREGEREESNAVPGGISGGRCSWGTWASKFGKSQELGQQNMALSPTGPSSDSKLKDRPLVREGATK